MAASIFIGCRKANVARSFKEIWALTNVPRKEIGKSVQDHGQDHSEKNAAKMLHTTLHTTVKTVFKPPKLRPRI